MFVILSFTPIRYFPIMVTHTICLIYTSYKYIINLKHLPTNICIAQKRYKKVIELKYTLNNVDCILYITIYTKIPSMTHFLNFKETTNSVIGIGIILA